MYGCSLEWWSGKKTQAVAGDVVLHEDPQEVESLLSLLYHLFGVQVTRSLSPER